MDEWRRLDIPQESLAFLPGYGIKAYLIAQDINQLYAHYGRDEAITSTCHVQCAFAPNRIETGGFCISPQKGSIQDFESTRE